MNLRTNYQKQDWVRFVSYHSAIISLAFAVVWLFIFAFLIPMFLFLGDTAKFLVSDEIQPLWGDALRKSMDDHSMTPETLLLVVMGFMILPILGCIHAISLTIDCVVVRLVSWGFKKANLYPTMRLVIIKNDKRWFRI